MTESSAISGANGASAVSAGASFAEGRALAVGAAVQVMAELAGAVLPDPADSLDRGVALSQVWAEQGQQGGRRSAATCACWPLRPARRSRRG
jgi:hypothetical protein